MLLSCYCSPPYACFVRQVDITCLLAVLEKGKCCPVHHSKAAADPMKLKFSSFLTYAVQLPLKETFESSWWTSSSFGLSDECSSCDTVNSVVICIERQEEAWKIESEPAGLLLFCERFSFILQQVYADSSFCGSEMCRDFCEELHQGEITPS